ncbi:Cof-type HAD-IIB family hydrolase [Neotabrizicola sp. VNH66]|uniref:Cof-type HAD-IIB family hydrolase n=1 Tax=Neotabrizicola sp. VNH66 TaxID=3400918 RepID=UPI003C0F67AE
MTEYGAPDHVATAPLPARHPPGPGGWMVALDLDGTVLDDHHRVPAAVQAAIADTRACGVRVVIVTARAPVAARHVLGGIGPVDAVICLGGAQMLRRDASGLWLADPDLPPDTVPSGAVAGVVRAARALSLPLAVYAGEGLFADRLEEMLTEELQITGMTGAEADLLALDRPVLKMLAIAPPGREGDLLRLRAEAEGALSCVLSHPRYLEIMRQGVRKGRALARLRDHWQVDRAHCVAMGDSENDLSMFAEAGLPIAMGNATPEVQAAARFVTASHRQAGVAVALNRLIAGYWTSPAPGQLLR